MCGLQLKDRIKGVDADVEFNQSNRSYCYGCVSL